MTRGDIMGITIQGGSERNNGSSMMQNFFRREMP